MTLPDSCRYVIGLCPDGDPQSLYESEDGAAGFLAYDSESEKLVEIHRLPDPETVGRSRYASIEERLKQARNLRHPNLAMILDQGEDDEERPYFVTEFVDGERLESWLKRVRNEAPLSEPLSISLILQLADLIAYLAPCPRLLSSVRIDDLAIALDRGSFLQIRLTDFGFDREEQPASDTELAIRWVQITGQLLQHLLLGTEFPDASAPEGLLGSLTDELRKQSDSTAYQELCSLKNTLLIATGLDDSDGRHRDPAFRFLSHSAQCPRGPLYSLMRESDDLESALSGQWQIDESWERSGPDGDSPFTVRAGPCESRTFEIESDEKKIDLEILPPERLVPNGLVSRLTGKMSHSYLKKHPSLTRARAIRCETDLTLIVNDAIDGFSLMRLMAHRSRLAPAEALHIARQIDRLMMHLEDAAEFEFGKPDPWRLIFHFRSEPSADTLRGLLGTVPVSEWPGPELKLRIEPVTDGLIQPRCSSWLHLEEKMNGKSLTALTLWMFEGDRFDQALSEGRAGQEPLSRSAEMTELFEKAAKHLDESEAPQRRRFLEMLEARIASGDGGESAPPEPQVKPAKRPRTRSAKRRRIVR